MYIDNLCTFNLSQVTRMQVNYYEECVCDAAIGLHRFLKSPIMSNASWQRQAYDHDVASS